MRNQYQVSVKYVFNLLNIYFKMSYMKCNKLILIFEALQIYSFKTNHKKLAVFFFKF